MIEIPTTIFDGDVEAIDALGDPAPFRFFATAKGWLVDKKTIFGRFIVPTDKNPFAKAPDWAARAYWDIPPLPAHLLGQAWGFFRAAWEARQSEAMVYLLRLGDTYLLHVPKQRASMGGVHARLDPAELPTGATIVGSIHSHCNFGAFHSGTDQADAKKNDGLHLTVGEVDKNPAQWAVMLSYSGHLWDLEWQHVAEVEPADLTPIAPPAEWLARIDEPAKYITTWGGAASASTVRHHGPHRYTWLPQEQRQDALWDADDDFWDAYWKAKGYQPHSTPKDELPKDGGHAFLSIDQLIRSGVMGEIEEHELDDLEGAEMGLIEWADYLLESYGVMVDFNFSYVLDGYEITDDDTKGTPQ